MDTNQITQFDFRGATVRVLTDEQGEPWFVGKDVAKVLGYSDANKAVAMHVDNEDKKLNDKTSSSFGQRGATLINESGLYSLILSSKLPQAREFKHWVTSEVLPQIRQTGGYIPTRNMRTGERLTEGEVLHLAANIMQRTIARYNQPADDCMTTTDIARTLGLTTKELNNLLVKKGVQFRSGGRYQLLDQYERLGYTQDRTFHYYGLDGEKKERKYLVWTKHGRDFIEKKVKN